TQIGKFNPPKYTNIYPLHLHKIFKENPKLHLLIDEFSFLVYNGLRKILNSIDDKRLLYKELISLIKESYGNEISNPNVKNILYHLDEYGQNIDRNTFNTVESLFWDTFGLHVPYIAEETSDIDSKIYLGGDEDEDVYATMTSNSVNNQIMNNLT